jgi:hypothetical protein
MEVELLRACVSCGDEKSLGKKTEAAAIMLMQSTESTTFQSAQEYREALGALSRFMAIRRRRNDLVSAGPRYGVQHHLQQGLVPALSGARALERTPIDSRESARGVWDICAAMGERGA